MQIQIWNQKIFIQKKYYIQMCKPKYDIMRSARKPTQRSATQEWIYSEWIKKGSPIYNDSKKQIQIWNQKMIHKSSKYGKIGTLEFSNLEILKF